MAGHFSSPQIVQWLFDTRSLWPVPKKSRSSDEVAELKIIASRELNLLTEIERQGVLKYYFLKDAKMSLASHLLKHLVITKYCGVQWSESHIIREKHSKPRFLHKAGAQLETEIDFNVSHQAGIVALIAAIGGDDVEWGDCRTGTDVVCVRERMKHDHTHIDENGFSDWIDMHAEVFAESEVRDMKFSSRLSILAPGFSLTCVGEDAVSRCERRGDQVAVEVIDDATKETSRIMIASGDIINQKIRRFYAMWCLREAYVKMTGEALMAPWLKDLEISLDMAPQASLGDVHDERSMASGEVHCVDWIRLKGRKVCDVQLVIRALGHDYMVASAIQYKHGIDRVRPGGWKTVDRDNDILNVADS